MSVDSTHEFPPTEHPLTTLMEEMENNSRWNTAKEELVKNEEKRVEKASAIARGYEREYIRCSQKHAGDQKALQEHCLPHAHNHMTWLASCYCPLPLVAYMRCKQSTDNAVCDKEMEGFQKCTTAYAKIAHLHLDYSIDNVA